MNDIVTVKDRYAQVIEDNLTDLGVADAPDIAILLVQRIEMEGLMPYQQEFRRGGVVDDDDRGDEIHRTIPSLAEGEYLLSRNVTGWAQVPA